MGYILKLLNVVFLGSVKYFWTPPYALILGLGVWDTFLALEVGGIAGYLFYFYLSRLVFAQLSKLWKKLYFVTPLKFKVSVEEWRSQIRKKRKNRKKFTKRNKLIIKIRRRYGMWGIIILTPIILSIPVGAILGNKYYSDKKTFLPLMILSIFLWGIVSILVFNVFPGLL